MSSLDKNFERLQVVLKAENNIIQKIEDLFVSNEKIGIFGDYDVDGATSTALLGNYFNQINQSALWFFLMQARYYLYLCSMKFSSNYYY